MQKVKLFVAGLLNDNFNEAYYIIDLEKKESFEIVVDNTAQKQVLLEMLNSQFKNRVLPYGTPSKELFLPYLINPHSCFKVGNKMLIFMLQAHFFREIDINSLENCAILLKKENASDVIFSASSIGNIEDQKIYLSVNSSNDRADIYNGIKKEMGFEFLLYDVKKRKFEHCKKVDSGLIDNMHQVGYSDKGFLVSLDMNISVNVDVNKMPDLSNETMRLMYHKAAFPKGKLFLWDMNEKKMLFIDPPLCTPAHVEFDVHDQSIFYVSCHNMSKFKGNMVLHGPGAIVKYRYSRGCLEQLNVFTDATFNRITTHKVFFYNGDTFLAVTGYPNFLYIIRADTMSLVTKIKLFEAESPIDYSNGLHVCTGNRNAPLYLQVNSEGTHVFLVNSNTCFSVEWMNGIVQKFKYTDRNFAVSAHIEIF